MMWLRKTRQSEYLKNALSSSYGTLMIFSCKKSKQKIQHFCHENEDRFEELEKYEGIRDLENVVGDERGHDSDHCKNHFPQLVWLRSSRQRRRFGHSTIAKSVADGARLGTCDNTVPRVRVRVL
ncbi:hypothetical protein C1H46_006300 [Malus baccata]|uniref:Uncharacterized protein n=1 Tax=Malus baccata TaxID=106549 RepID=A0A540NAE5_MALBA|nr:hypothetical protein C1H46_006300 [Malus baccata]